MKSMKLSLLSAMFVLSTPTFAAWVSQGLKYNDIKNVRVSDVARFRGEVDRNLSLFSKWAQKNEDQLFGDVKIKKVHNLFLTDFPKRDGSLFKYEIGAFIELDLGKEKSLEESQQEANSSSEEDIVFQEKPLSSTERFYFVFFTATGSELEESGSRVKGDVQISNRRNLSLREADLSVEVSLASRKAIVKDDSHGIKMVFPLGVGAFDESVLNDGFSVITPRFKNGVLDKRYAMYERKMPRYYMKKPFIRLLSDEDPKTGFTGIGFHAQPNGDEFIRAFDSHGCMRMQDDDLYTMYWLVSENATGKMPIVVNFNLDDSSEHPFPKKDKPYKTVLNTGKADKPDFTLDIDDLVQLTSNYKTSAPVEKLEDDVNDDVNVIFDYEMGWRVKEKREGKLAACKEKNKVDLTQFEVSRSEIVTVKKESYVTPWMSDRERSKAEREYEKELKRQEREYERALKDAKRAKEDAIKQNKEDLDDCIKNIRKKRTLKEKLYRWWVHGKK